MSVPDYQTFMLPLLQPVSDQRELSEHRVGWARTDLKKVVDLLLAITSH